MGEGAQIRNWAGAEFHRRVVVGYRHMKAVVDLNAVARMTAVGTKVRRMEVVDGLEIGHMSCLECRTIVKVSWFGWHKGVAGVEVEGCTRYGLNHWVGRRLEGQILCTLLAGCCAANTQSFLPAISISSDLR